MVEYLKAARKIEPAPSNKVRFVRKDSQACDVSVSKSGWVSPQYKESRRVVLKPNVLEANRCLGLLPETDRIQYYKVLRTQIQQRMREKGWKTLMITSAHPGEGKTVTSINLAAMFAKEYNQTVMLVDADLKTQSVHRYLGYQGGLGLTDYLLGECSVEDIIVWPSVEKLTVISGGRIMGEGTEALCSPRMHELVVEMKQRYNDRYLFFDVPPILGRADAMAFAEFIDGIVMVVRSGRSPMPDVQKALSYLPQHKFIGFIMNAQD